jgi:hypothetical protein
VIGCLREICYPATYHQTPDIIETAQTHVIAKKVP